MTQQSNFSRNERKFASQPNRFQFSPIFNRLWWFVQQKSAKTIWKLWMNFWTFSQVRNSFSCFAFGRRESWIFSTDETNNTKIQLVPQAYFRKSFSKWKEEKHWKLVSEKDNVERTILTVKSLYPSGCETDEKKRAFISAKMPFNIPNAVSRKRKTKQSFQDFRFLAERYRRPFARDRRTFSVVVAGFRLSLGKRSQFASLRSVGRKFYETNRVEFSFCFLEATLWWSFIHSVFGKNSKFLFRSLKTCSFFAFRFRSKRSGNF